MYSRSNREKWKIYYLCVMTEEDVALIINGRRSVLIGWLVVKGEEGIGRCCLTEILHNQMWHLIRRLLLLKLQMTSLKWAWLHKKFIHPVCIMCSNKGDWVLLLGFGRSIRWKENACRGSHREQVSFFFVLSLCGGSSLGVNLLWLICHRQMFKECVTTFVWQHIDRIGGALGGHTVRVEFGDGAKYMQEKSGTGLITMVTKEIVFIYLFLNLKNWA